MCSGESKWLLGADGRILFYSFLCPVGGKAEGLRWNCGMGAEHEPSTWKTKLCCQRGVKTAKEALVILAVDATMGVGLVVQVLAIPSQGRPGEPCSPCNGGHCASPRASILKQEVLCFSRWGINELVGSAVNSQLQ